MSKPIHRRRAAVATILILLALLGIACQALGPDVDFPEDVDPEGTERIEWSAPSGTVSGLVGGERGARRVVLIHGTPGFAASWSEYLVGGPEGLEVVALDRPGFGRSAPEGPVPELELQAAAVEPLLEARNGQLPLVVGHSLGGPIALRVAADYPERVGGLVILAGNVDPELEDWRWYNRAAAWLYWALPRSWENSNRELKPHRAELEALTRLLPRVTCPVAIVHGTEDSLVPYANAEYLADRLPNAAEVELVTRQGGDHLFIFRDTRVLWEQVERLLAR
ncbi:MAG: alpha/beta hydrolase [Planctomycetota bacterium]